MSATEAEPRTSLLTQLVAEFAPFPLPIGAPPDGMPSDGPDPYGNPDPNPAWMAVDWRAHLRRVEVPTPEEPPATAALGPGPEQRLDTALVSYVEIGDGPQTLLFVHGLSGSWQNWLENIPHFSRTHRVVALDLPGFGHSPLPPWEISIEAYGRLLHRFTAAIGIDNCVAIGNSMGGFVAAEAAIRQPGCFEKLVLVSAAGITSARLRRQPAETTARMAVAAAPLLMRLEKRGIRRRRVRWVTFRGLFQDPDRLRFELLYEQFHNSAGRPGFLPAVQGLVGYDFSDRLTEIDVPTLIVWGRNDRIVPAQDAVVYHERIASSRLEIFDHTGHLAMLERPVRFNRLLEGFLAEP
jgi:pimeloyl-ACP methyl ester carboxylesterase